jgi:hypothetical protein
LAISDSLLDGTKRPTSVRSVRHLIPGAPFELASGAALEHAAPLFEKKGDSCVMALIPNLSDPRWIDWPGTRTRFPTNDDPIDVLQVQAGERAQQRFE